MITILGAGGAIGNKLASLLAARGRLFRLVGRSPHPIPGASEVVVADLADREQTIRAVAGSSIVYLLAGLKYDTRVWRNTWPRVMENAIEACTQAGARLAFFDNVYMYGKVDGPMTEKTPFNPSSRKGEIRANVATMLIEAWKSGALTAMIARAADFYGPDTANGIPNVLVFAPFAKGEKASCLVTNAMPHSYTYTPDAASALLQLTERPSAWNQTWHLPTTPKPPTAEAFITMAAQAFGVPPKYRMLRKPLLKIAGLFNPQIGELYEMLYQNDSLYIFDSGKFAREFGFAGTPYEQGIRETAASFTLAAQKSHPAS